MTNRPTIREILHKTEAYLRDKNVDSPRLSAQLIVAKGLGVSRVALFMDLDRPLSPGELDVLRPMAARRGRGEPAAYILGEREFYGLAFEVNPAVLIPRPETEMLVEEALRLLERGRDMYFADLGTGSGCLAVALAAHMPAARGLALDASAAALDVARRNAQRHAVAHRLEFLEADFASLPPQPGGYHLIVSNPPYVSGEEYQALSGEVAGFEPRAALTPGASGLEAYPGVVAAAWRTLAPGGWLLLEIGWKQGADVVRLLEDTAYGFKEVAVLPDLAGHDRVARARKPEGDA